MRVQITHMKAPWPLGAVVGDVVDVESIPAWAVGKCVQVADDAEVTIGSTAEKVFVVNPDETKPKKGK
jgi:hypothetical protein